MRSACLLSTVFLAALAVGTIQSVEGKKATNFQLSRSSQSLAIRNSRARNNGKRQLENTIQKVTVDSSRGGGGAGAASSKTKDLVTGALIMALIEKGLNKIYVSQGITFPSHLGGCIALLIFLLLAEAVSPLLRESIFTIRKGTKYNFGGPDCAKCS